MKRPKVRPLVLPLTLLALLILAAWINSPQVAQLYDAGADRVAALPPAPAFTRGQRVLMLSPHPDDETLCCAGMIQQARAAGADVTIVWATAGDGFEFDAMVTRRVLDPSAQDMRALGNARVLEARRAAALLGVDAAHTVMLGYPDGGLHSLYTTNYARAYTVPTTAAAAVYITGALTPGAPYTGQALEADLGRVLDRVQPDLVLVPSPQDFHPDHHTLSSIAQRLLAHRQQTAHLRFWMVHGGLEWPLPKGLHPQLSLTVPPLAPLTPWQRVDLADAQAATKLAAVDAYGTQTRILGRFMRAFVRRNELLSAP
ncbi:LmbE family N-acetylglucosaminyl deacetylase [Deinococcus metalli]|uniref:LmbE family N-acetylglucosaminyl deacetylase n=1 Tax=Deinococcus metalli TaxID=1141878 RepID=A0A7W8NTX6_9DEIO|nr:PIG-L deacetylase family protein [Deinococcus metalli]MBB5378697.1 LmbE family N-acetylglucosaminyl deacetylase [Deinococcus metalli]GHF61774.1 PIG-L domain-containing protein [Deinococcus metalli]